MSDRFIEIGTITKPHGLKGDVKVNSSSPDFFLLEEFSSVYLSPVAGKMEKLAIDRVRPGGKHIILHFEGLNCIEAVQRLAGRVIEVPEDRIPKLPEGEYYQFQIIGMDVVTESGERLGIVRDIIETGSNDVYEVEGEKGSSFLLPAIKDVIIKIILDEKKIIIRVVEGLLDDD